VRIDLRLNFGAYQVGEVVAGLALHQSGVVAEPRDVENVTFESCGVGFEHYEDESWQKLVGADRSPLTVLQDFDHALAAAHHAGELLLGGLHRIHT
jgi:hypothetical protein